MRRSISLVLVTAFSIGCVSMAFAQSASRAVPTVTIPRSSVANPGDVGKRAHTNLRFSFSPSDFKGLPKSVYGPPFPGAFYEDPASIGCIYHLRHSLPGCNPYAVTLNPEGGNNAIAIVDAYDNPNALADLQLFTSQFGLAALNSKSFHVVYAPPGSSCTGTGSEPVVDPSGGWELEESLDVQWAHAIAPNAAIYLVEAQSNYYTDLFCAVSVASNIVAAAGGGEVSMSWGGGEFSSETYFDSYLQTPNVVYFAATGDSPGVIYPAASPYVVAVGGTSLSTNASTGDFIRENTWQEGGGGPSAYESTPSYQSGITGIVGTQRGTPDVSAVANPNTGVWVQDSNPYNGVTYCTAGTYCWWIVGGTSVATPVWASIVNAAGSFAASSSAELTTLYADSGSDLTDITLGTCGPYMGYFAVPGYDFCTGRGSPKTEAGK